MGSLIPFNRVGERKTFTKIHVDTTNFKIPSWEPCVNCGKTGEIISGLPKGLDVTIPLTKEEHEVVAQIPFWINGNFEITCNNGYSHVAKGLGPKSWVISLEKNFIDGEYIKWEGTFEEALARFIPILMNSRNEKVDYLPHY